MSQPNILFMIADDHRFDAIRARGNETVHTPNLDRLMAEGTCMTHTYIMGSTSGAVCMPSRGMLLTGRSLFHAADAGDGRWKYPIPDRYPLLPEVFRQAGYTTYGIGKWHNERETFARCFEGGSKIFFGGMSDHDKVPTYDFDPTGEYPPEKQYIGDKFSTEMFGDAAINFLNNYEDEKPFFLYTAFTAPHDPRTPPPEYTALYPPESIPLPENFLPEHPFDNGELVVRDEKLAPHPRTPEVVQQHIADYYGMISHMDAKIGEILQALEDNGLADNTIVVYTVDHGLAVGQHGLMGKQNLYDHSMRVPLIVRGPGVPQDAQRSSLCYMYDINPTLCEMAGIPVPATVEGQSLLPIIQGDTSQHRSQIFSAYQNVMGATDQYQRMVREGRYKLIEYFVDGNRNTQLFDLEDDPRETRNLAGDAQYEPQLQHLQQALNEWQHKVDDPTLESLP